MRMPLPVAAFLFVLGGSAALVGDHGHVVTGTTQYLAFTVAYVWSSPFWFPIMVGGATVAIAEVRLRLPDRRDGVTSRQGVAGVAAVIGIYTVTALVHTAPAMPGFVLVCALAALTWCALGDRWGAVCGVIAAVVGPAAEAVIVAMGQFRYVDGSDHLIGVGQWLPPLYFAFGVVVALLAELSTLEHPVSAQYS